MSKGKTPKAGAPSAAVLATIPPGATRFPRAECPSRDGGSFSVSLSIRVVETTGHRHAGAPGVWIDRPDRSGLPANIPVSWEAQFPAFASKLQLAYAFSGVCGGVKENAAVVGVSGLVELAASADYKLVGADAAHPQNHFGQPSAVAAIAKIAAQYRRDFPQAPVLEVGHMSLPMGGLFDFAGDWRADPGHLGHDQGYEADLKKPLDAERRAGLLAIIRAHGGVVEPDRHAEFFHVGFAAGGYKNSLGAQIVADYRASSNRRPGGDCYAVAYERVNAAVKRICGADSALPSLTAFQAFDRLWGSKIDPPETWKKLDASLRGKGAAGAMASIGMGSLVEAADVWAGKLQPGAALQLWQYQGDFEKVWNGVLPAGDGHSVIFLEYVERGGKIIGMKIADQGTPWSEPKTFNREEFFYVVGANLFCKNI